MPELNQLLSALLLVQDTRAQTEGGRDSPASPARGEAAGSDPSPSRSPGAARQFPGAIARMRRM